jgi:hypothetical protein
MDGFLCFELLETSHYPEINYAHTLVLQELSLFRRLSDEYLFNESIVKYCLNWLIERIEMVEKDKAQEEYSEYNQEINSAFKDEPFDSMLDLFEAYLHDEKYFIRLHINEERIRAHLKDCMTEWRLWRFFNNWKTPRNLLTAKKQEEQIVNKLTKIEEEGYDMKNYILNLKELLEWSHIEKWINDNERDEPELSINPFMTLWSLQDKWMLKIQFWSTNLMVLDDPIYRIEMIKENNIKSEIDCFLEKIQVLKELAKEWVLETRKEQDLLTEIRNFQYNTIIGDEVILLKIQRLKAHPQTIWATPRNGGFSGGVNQYILDWENIFMSYKWKSDAKNQKVKNIDQENIQINIWEISNELRLEKATWKIFRWNLKICELSPDTTSFKFLEYLMGNKWSIVRYEDIKKNVNPLKMDTTDSDYCRKLKNSLDLSIRKHIKAKRIGFIFDPE